MKKRVLMAMSGGIDSCVASILLHQQGYEIVGLTMKTWDYASTTNNSKETGCCSLDSINDARKVSVTLGFHHFVLDLREEFGDAIINNFVGEYLNGRTPNPCVLCNTHIKWSALLKRADMLKCDYIATGHYAKVKFENERYFITQSADNTKDQTYVLWGLRQEDLKRTLFPLENLTKTETRKIASDMGFEELSKKSESYEICFIPNNDYRSFLKFREPEKISKIGKGDFLNTNGEKIGEHEGYPFYTIGQRKGLGIATGTPLFVKEINSENNSIVLGLEHELEKTIMYVKDFNIMKYKNLNQPIEAKTKIRYKDPGTLSTIYPKDNVLEVVFHAPVKGIAPGQSAVFYEGNDLIGGGIISF